MAIMVAPVWLCAVVAAHTPKKVKSKINIRIVGLPSSDAKIAADAYESSKTRAPPFDGAKT